MVTHLNQKMSLERVNYIFLYSSVCRDPRGCLLPLIFLQ